MNNLTFWDHLTFSGNCFSKVPCFKAVWEMKLGFRASLGTGI